MPDTAKAPASATALELADFDPPCLWPDSVDGFPAVVLFRRTFAIEGQPSAAVLRIYAEAGYILWINGVWIGRGPTNHHPHRLPVRAYANILDELRRGENVLAVLVHAPGEAYHHYIPTGRPGLAADLSVGWPDGRTLRLQTDDAWRCTTDTGWRCDVPRRSWASGFIEVHDAATAPERWRQPALDDGDWSTPDVSPSALPTPDAVYIPEDLPALRGHVVPAARLIHIAELHDPPIEVRPDFGHGTYAQQLMQTDRHPLRDVRLGGWLDAEGAGSNHGEGDLRIDGLSLESGAVVEFDLGAEWVGHAHLEVVAESAGVIDVGWGERIDGGRVAVLQKGTSYVDQVHIPAGLAEWEPYQFNAGRYLALYLRGFTGSVTLRRVGWHATEPDVEIPGRFTCDDGQLNRIFDLCRHTLRVGTQESLMDCPTRERATYLGDGFPTAYWTALLTGDTRHWSHLTREAFARPFEEGLLPSSLFSGRDDTLIDYSLLSVVWTALYLRFTGDRATVTDALPACREVLAYFDRSTNACGLFDWHWPGPPNDHTWEQRYHPGPRRLHYVNLFIDHPGMGWHNPEAPGIDRRGINAAINMLRTRALDALAELEHAVGDTAAAPAYRDRAQAIREACRQAFHDSTRGVFVDGGQLAQVSQQTNTWALWTRTAAEDAAVDLARRIVHADLDDVAENGPYFWTYLYPELRRLDLHRDALDMTRRLYGRMLDDDATTLWETWAGDDKDSRCHPWSAAALQHLLCGVAGLPSGLDPSPPPPPPAAADAARPRRGHARPPRRTVVHRLAALRRCRGTARFDPRRRRGNARWLSAGPRGRPR